MSYCVNCGVELDTGIGKCPLCGTPVINPNELIPKEAAQPFPEKKAVVEPADRKDLAILLSVFVLATAVTCGLLNVLVFPGVWWSLAVIGACVVLWVGLFPVAIFRKLSVYAVLLLDGLAVALYLYMLAYMIGSHTWYFRLGLPITAMAVVLMEMFALCVKILPCSFLSVSLYLDVAAAVLCIGLEFLIDRYLQGSFSPGWSAVVLTVCLILGITIITLLSRRKLRGEVRRRLHL
ncbi:MAG: DUF3488 domain-containing protein [Clostridium sp.]|nr:DUF3488 domain-containing protein [Acetatifactor muris]MCM1527362.1 DUF3488 domain-containing protein [Bacteroides sp.]MCM1563574.1 DUF3488 domain-containing protein [Clostridium sp.]